MYSYGPPHMAGQKQDDQLEHTSSSYLRIRDVALKTCQKRWTIGRSGERGSGISVPVARHDDDEIPWYQKWIDICLSICAGKLRYSRHRNTSQSSCLKIIRKPNRKLWVLHLMATPAQLQSHQCQRWNGHHYHLLWRTNFFMSGDMITKIGKD